MKWAFFLLLGLNIAFFGWQHFQEPAPEPRPPKVKANAGGKTIPLLHEVDNGKKTMADVMESGNSKPKKKNDAAKPAPEADRPPSTTEPPPLSEIEKKVAAVEAKHTERIEASIAARKSGASAERAETRDAEPPKRAVAAAPVNRSCYAAGPFASKGNAEAAIAKLGGSGFSAELREAETKGKQVWWVLDVTQSERAAMKRVEEFRKKNVKDAEVVESGEYQGMVLLGKYPDEDQAAARVNALVKSGFRPVVEKSFDSTVQYWVDFDEAENRKLSAAQWKEAMGASGSITKQERTCK